MRVPVDATLDVQASFKEVIQEIERLKNQWVLINGSRLVGAQDAVTYDGLVTLRQLRAAENAESADIAAVRDELKQLKDRNNLV